MIWVAIGQAPGLFLYSYLGTLGQLGLNLARGKTHPRVIEYLIWLGGFATAAIVLVLLGRIALRLLQEAEREVVIPKPMADPVTETIRQDIVV
jgi:uncharacterized membrane protein YdjX (TVP38/TMEM64 family)